MPLAISCSLGTICSSVTQTDPRHSPGRDGIAGFTGSPAGLRTFSSELTQLSCGPLVMFALLLADPVECFGDAQHLVGGSQR